MYVFVCHDSRRWIQAVFCHSDDASSSSSMEASVKIDLPGEEYIEPKVRENTLTEVVNNFDVDMSEGVAVDMFGISPSNDNVVKFYLFPFIFLVVPKFS